LKRLCAVVIVWLSAGCSGGETSTPVREETQVVRADASSALVQARRGFRSTFRPSEFDRDPIDTPPPNLFEVVRYESPIGSLAAYLTIDPGDGDKHPAIVWITGGDCNSIGEVWEDAPADNDQSAAAYRKAGIVMMFPSLRGGNVNPGVREGFWGEVEDILAAAEILAAQPYVDPQRIYLGGHSTGATMALITAECTSRFRAVFAFGPVEDVSEYGAMYLPFETSEAREIELRSPGRWLNAIHTRTYVFEGEDGNIESLQGMKRSCKNGWLAFYPIEGGDHFNVLAPMNRLIAKKILADEGPTCGITITEAEIQKAMSR
jgi:hypothetical protein